MKNLSELKRILEDERAACAKMLGMEEEKSQALISGDAQALLAVIGSQQALIMAQKSLEEKRIALCGEWKKATLREMIDTSPECREALEPVFLELSRIVAALKKMNARNRKLLEARLSTIRFMCEQLGIGAPNTYARGVQIRA
jgi:flagellar biosynthesis/type III secretory pathway chaperone